MSKEKATKVKIAPHIVRHAMREARNRAARLLAFGSCIMYAEHNPASRDQALLAIDDLVSFALHVRRALENLGARKKFRDLKLIIGRSPVATKYIEDTTEQTDITFLQILGRIVHSKGLGIALTDAKTNKLVNKNGVFPKVGDYYPHHFWLKSDKPGDFVICIESFVLTYLREVEPILDTMCWEAGFISPNEDDCYVKKPKTG